MSFLKRFRPRPGNGSQPNLADTFPATMIAEAKANPNGWVYEIEGDFERHVEYHLSRFAARGR